MISVKGDVELNTIKKTARVSLFSDTKSEVTNDIDVPEIPRGYEIEQGSSVITANGEFAFRKSDGTWNWIV